MRSITIIFGLWLCFYGVAGNQLVVTANGGRMPVFMEEISDADRIALQTSPRHQEGDARTRLKLLSDIIHLEQWDRVISIGDVLMTIAIIVPGIGYVVRLRKKRGLFLDNNATISMPIAFCAMITSIFIVVVQYYGLTVF